MTPKCDCGVAYILFSTQERGEQYWDFYQCPVCGEPTHDVRYMFTPFDCPGHQPEFIGTKFVDGKTGHSIQQIVRCSRCGATDHVDRNTDAAGISGRVEIEDPRVQSTLLMNESTWKRLIPKDMQELSVGTLPDKVRLPKEADL